MKVLIGGFIAESNAYVDTMTNIENFIFSTEAVIAKNMYIDEIAIENDIELVPSFYANGMGGGCVSNDAFMFIAKKILEVVENKQNEIDGIFLFLHGASYIKGLEGTSGEHYIIREIRKIVGQFMPIAMVMDPHGNLSQEQANNCNIIRTFRHSPHTDRKEAHQIVFKCLIDLLNNRRDIHPIYRKVPILLGGERCVSTDEPLVSINELLDKVENDSRILCCSYHIGYLRHDSDKCGASIIVVPNTINDIEYAERKANEIFDFVWLKHREFHFTGYSADPDEALNEMLMFQGNPVFLTDSGDNVTAGAEGINTTVLRQVLKLDHFNNKKILFAMIVDKELCKRFLVKKRIGDVFEFNLGVNKNILSTPVLLKGELIAIGDLHHHYQNTEVVGTGYTLKLVDLPITIIVGDSAVSFAETSQYEYVNVELEKYDLIVVKQGYLYPELKALSKHYVMSLTDGTTLQKTEGLTYKKVLRPIYPLDNI